MRVIDFRASGACIEQLCQEPKQDACTTALARVLIRTDQRHALLTGNPGVGKTSVLYKFAESIRSSKFKFLQNHELLYLDVRNVGEQDSRPCLETILAAVTESHRTVLFIDDLSALFRTTQGRSNKPLVRAVLSRPNVSLVGTMSNWDYAELVGNDLLMMNQCARIELSEPDEQPLADLVAFVADRLCKPRNITLDRAVVGRAVALSSTFLLSEFQPAKTVNVIRRVIDELRFCDEQGLPLPESIEESAIVKVISEKTAIPENTIRGQGRCFDFRHALEEVVVGQDDAVRQVAMELELIAAGLNEAKKPASVMMFAGTTGVGKTELAKRIAELYSSSGRLQVYPMGNFTEPHSVSGIVGVPPGYVGHEDGGRLVNDLLADPYTVFLLDEAEKCHPNIWKPFLNLFDEGWIVDQRGRKAYADRAIFILTTNAGDRSISQLTRSGKNRDEIAEQVRKTLSRVRQERSSQPVFPPQFLSRMKRIIVFNPLSQEAMIEIAKRVVANVANRWRSARQKELVVADELIQWLGIHGNEKNEQVNGEEGGRIITKLVRECIEHRVLMKAMAEPESYSASTHIRVECSGESGGESIPGARVVFS